MSIIEDLKLQYKIGGFAQKLIYWNVALFVIPYIVFGLLGLFGIEINFLYYVSLSSNPADLLWKPWTLITYFFFHSGFFHILFNMMILNFSSRLFLSYFSQKQFLSLYFVGGIFAGIVYILSYFLFPSLAHLQVSLVGASGAIMAVLFAAATFSPLTEIRLMFIGNVKLWHIAFALIVIDLIQLPLENTGGHLAHLGGAFFGYLYIKQIQKGIDLGSWFTKLIDKLAVVFSQKEANPFKKVHVNYNNEQVKSASKIIKKDIKQQQIDEILDKVSQSGYDSLSAGDKDFLFKVDK
jgi:membrane associated rhomboid family serine protease